VRTSCQGRLRYRKGKISVVQRLLGPRLEELEGVLAVGSDSVTALLPVGRAPFALVGRRELRRLCSRGREGGREGEIERERE
jgi:hypothetical protein